MKQKTPNVESTLDEAIAVRVTFGRTATGSHPERSTEMKHNQSDKPQFTGMMTGDVKFHMVPDTAKNFVVDAYHTLMSRITGHSHKPDQQPMDVVAAVYLKGLMDSTHREQQDVFIDQERIIANLHQQITVLTERLREAETIAAKATADLAVPLTADKRLTASDTLLRQDVAIVGELKSIHNLPMRSDEEREDPHADLGYTRYKKD